jgi:DNA-binding CsgD family transcriptional regulator
MAVVDGLLGRAAARETVVLDISGEPGIGKTRLLGEAVAAARSRGFDTRHVRASELERDAPHAVVAAILGAPTPESAERHRVARAVATGIETATSRTPLVVAVDDLQWADAGSVDALAHVVDRIASAPLALVFASRRGRRPAAFSAALERCERAGRLARAELEPLGAGDAAALLGPAIEGPLRERLIRESGGNPFYLEQLARAGRDDRGRASPDARAIGVPRAVAAALAVELAALSSAARGAAHALSVAGDGADAELVAAVAGADQAGLLGALDELIDADIVRADAAAPLFAFRHPIVRRAVEESAPAAWRIGAHRRAAAELRSRGAPVGRLAPHVERGADAGDRDAIGLLAAAASECLTSAPAVAARYYRAALRLQPADTAGTAGPALRLPLALALATAGAVEEARDELRDVLGSLPRDDPRRATVVTTMAAIEHLLGRYDEGRELLVREVAALAPERTAERAALTQSLADNHYFAGDWQAMRDAAASAAQLATAAGADALRIEASAAASVADGALGDANGAAGWLGDASRAFDGIEDPPLVAHLDTPFWLGLALLHMEEYGRAARVFARGIDLSRRTGQESAAVQLGVGLASVCALTGRLAEGRRAATFAVDVARLMGVPNLLGWAEVARTWIALREGRLDEALEAGAYVERLAAAVGPAAVSGGLCALAEARVLVGDAREGRDALLLAAAGDELDRLNPPLRTWAYEVLSRAELAQEDTRRAAEWADRAESQAAVLGLGRDLASARLAAARVALATDRPGVAVDAALASAAAAQECGALPQLIRARIVAAEACRRAGDADRAEQLLDAAHRDARACGASGERNEAERALRALGRRTRGRSAATAGSHLLGALTERERDVAELVADRLRNREIAARLHVSEKTVERHVTGILRKLGVDSRVDVARAVDRERASR